MRWYRLFTNISTTRVACAEQTCDLHGYPLGDDDLNAKWNEANLCDPASSLNVHTSPKECDLGCDLGYKTSDDSVAKLVCSVVDGDSASGALSHSGSVCEGTPPGRVGLSARTFHSRLPPAYPLMTTIARAGHPRHGA